MSDGPAVAEGQPAPEFEMGVDRSTFPIDANGTVTTVLRGVDHATHAGDVLAAPDAQG